jgi:hypothetical protein
MKIAKICKFVYLSPFENHIIVIQVVLNNWYECWWIKIKILFDSILSFDLLRTFDVCNHHIK